MAVKCDSELGRELHEKEREIQRDRELTDCYRTIAERDTELIKVRLECQRLLEDNRNLRDQLIDLKAYTHPKKTTSSLTSKRSVQKASPFLPGHQFCGAATLRPASPPQANHQPAWPDIGHAGLVIVDVPLINSSVLKRRFFVSLKFLPAVAGQVLPRHHNNHHNHNQG